MNLSLRNHSTGKRFGIMLAASAMTIGLSFTTFAAPEKETLVFTETAAQEQTLDYSAPTETAAAVDSTSAASTPNAKTAAAQSDAATAETAAVDLNFDADVLEVENELEAITTAAEKTGDTSLGEQVVSFARQFIGNKYRFGGSSLTSGTDCSGFVMSVFRNFGVELPHSSQELASVGTAVSSLAEAKLGDILVYPGHCGIYVGNGKLLSALNSRKGITICSANYNRITAIRRIFG